MYIYQSQYRYVSDHVLFLRLVDLHSPHLSLPPSSSELDPLPPSGSHAAFASRYMANHLGDVINSTSSESCMQLFLRNTTAWQNNSVLLAGWEFLAKEKSPLARYATHTCKTGFHCSAMYGSSTQMA